MLYNCCWKINSLTVKMADVIRFNRGFTATVTGQTGTGKTTWVRKFIDNLHNLMDKPYERVIFYYMVWQPAYEQINAEFRQGPLCDEITDHEALVVLDDMFMSSVKNADLAETFCTKAHHQDLGIIFCTQYFFFDSPIIRTCNRNSSHIVLMQHPRNYAVAEKLGLQLRLIPQKGNAVLQAYEKVVRGSQWSYLVIDLSSQTSDDRFRMFTDIFPEEQPVRVFF